MYSVWEISTELNRALTLHTSFFVTKGETKSWEVLYKDMTVHWLWVVIADILRNIWLVKHDWNTWKTSISFDLSFSKKWNGGTLNVLHVSRTSSLSFSHSLFSNAGVMGFLRLVFSRKHLPTWDDESKWDTTTQSMCHKQWAKRGKAKSLSTGW